MLHIEPGTVSATKSLRHCCRIFIELSRLQLFADIELSIFYPYRGVEGKFSGVCQRHFPRESGIKIVFPRGLLQVFQSGHTGQAQSG